MMSRWLILLALTAIFPVLYGCAAKVAHHGNPVLPDALETVQPGISTSDDVLQALGVPSATGAFDNPTWYYIAQTIEQTAFYAPEISERQVVMIAFNEQGLVEDVRELDLSAGRDVALIQRSTPTSGRELTILEQIMGNIGRFTGDE